jgi:hypothetical protein
LLFTYSGSTSIIVSLSLSVKEYRFFMVHGLLPSFFLYPSRNASKGIFIFWGSFLGFSVSGGHFTYFPNNFTTSSNSFALSSIDSVSNISK